MITAIAVSALLNFGGVPFGMTEESIRKNSPVLTEEQLADGNRALVKREKIAGHDADRKWLIKNGKVAEGILLFSFKSDLSECSRLQRTALSSLEANYEALPKLIERKDEGDRGFQSEMWVTNLADGGRIEQRMIYVPLLTDCTVSGRYFPATEESAAF